MQTKISALLIALAIWLNSCQNQTKSPKTNTGINQNTAQTRNTINSSLVNETLTVDISDTANFYNYDLFSKMFICCEEAPIFDNGIPRKIITTIKSGTRVFLKPGYLSLHEGFVPDTCCAASFKRNGHFYKGYVNGNKFGIGAYLTLHGKKYILAARYKKYTADSQDSVYKKGLAEVILMDNGKIISYLPIEADGYINLLSFKDGMFHKPIRLFILNDIEEACEYNESHTLFYLDSFTLKKICSDTSYEYDGSGRNNYSYILPSDRYGKVNMLKSIFTHERFNHKGKYKLDSIAEIFYYYDGNRFLNKGTASMLIK